MFKYFSTPFLLLYPKKQLCFLYHPCYYGFYKNIWLNAYPICLTKVHLNIVLMLGDKRKPLRLECLILSPINSLGGVKYYLFKVALLLDKQKYSVNYFLELFRLIHEFLLDSQITGKVNIDIPFISLRFLEWETRNGFNLKSPLALTSWKSVKWSFKALNPGGQYSWNRNVNSER